MANAKDRITKEQFFLQSLPFLEHFLNLDPIASTEEISEKIQHTIEREPDFVRLVTSTSGYRYILHLEFQTTNDPELLDRNGEYHMLLLRRYGVPIVHYVLYFGQEPPTMPTKVEPEKVYTGFELINLQDYQAQDFIAAESPEEVVMAILANFGDVPLTEVVDQILLRLQQLTEGKSTFTKYTTQLEVYAELRKLESLTKNKVEKMAVTLDFTKTTAYQTGIAHTNRATAIRMLKLNKNTLEEIAEVTELPLETIIQLQAELEE